MILDCPILHFDDGMFLSAEQAVINMYKKWVEENKREPLYFVTHPDDYHDLYTHINMSSDVLKFPKDEVAARVQGVSVLVNDAVPKGRCGFVG